MYSLSFHLFATLLRKTTSIIQRIYVLFDTVVGSCEQ